MGGNTNSFGSWGIDRVMPDVRDTVWTTATDGDKLYTLQTKTH